MYKDDEVRLRHILNAAREAVSFIEGKDRENLEADRKLNLSLVRLLEIIGEAAKNFTLKDRWGFLWHPNPPGDHVKLSKRCPWMITNGTSSWNKKIKKLRI